MKKPKGTYTYTKAHGERLLHWEINYTKADAKELKRKNAVHLARCWVLLAKQFHKRTWPEQVVINFRNGLLETFMVATHNALKTANANFFRHFADALETKGAPHHLQKRFLSEIHKPDSSGRVPRFTHSQILDDAARRGIEMDERQLRRLMGELEYSFKNARR